MCTPGRTECSPVPRRHRMLNSNDFVDFFSLAFHSGGAIEMSRRNVSCHVKDVEKNLTEAAATTFNARTNVKALIMCSLLPIFTESLSPPSNQL